MEGIVGKLGRAARLLPSSRFKSRTGRVLAAVLAKVGCDPVQAVAMKDGSRLFLDARERTQGAPFWDGDYAPDEIALLQVSFNPARTFVDIGANVGLITIPMARYVTEQGTTGRIVAVEPIPANLEALNRSLALTTSFKQRVTALETALGAAAGTMAMTTERRGKSSNAAVTAVGLYASPTLIVSVRTLDDVLREQGVIDVDVIKIDVEGFELAVLQGATLCLEQMRPIIFGEFNNMLMPRLGVTFRHVASLTRPMGYRFFGVAGHLEVVEVPEPPPNFGNAFLVPDERVEAWRDQLCLAQRSVERR